MRDDGGRPRRRDAWALAGRRRLIDALPATAIPLKCRCPFRVCIHTARTYGGQRAGLEPPHSSAPVYRRRVRSLRSGQAAFNPTRLGDHQGATHRHHPRGGISGLSAKREAHTHSAPSLPPPPACLPPLPHVEPSAPAHVQRQCAVPHDRRHGLPDAAGRDVGAVTLRVAGVGEAGAQPPRADVQ